MSNVKIYICLKYGKERNDQQKRNLKINIKRIITKRMSSQTVSLKKLLKIIS